MRFISLPALALVALLPFTAEATNVQGTLSSNTTWDVAGSPWILVGDVTVPSSTTLTIDPGVQVMFATGDTIGSGADTSKAELIISGALSAQGTPSLPITINAGSGYGIRVLSGGSAILDYANVAGGSGYYGVVTDGTLSATHSTIHGGTDCLRIQSGTATFNDGSLTGCTNGLYAAAAATLDHNTIADNSNDGAYVSSFPSGTFTFTNNIVTDNDNYGVEFSSVASNSPTRVFHHNDVWGNSNANLYNVNRGTGGLSVNPLYVAPGSNYRLTSNSPARFGASDGSDPGAFPYAGDPTPGLYGTLWTSLSLPAGTYALDGDLTIPAGVTLALAPGATLNLTTMDLMASGASSHTEIIVEGTLSALGTPSSGITFNNGSAYGLRVLSGGSARLDYVTIIGGTFGAETEGTLSATNTTIDSSTTCLYVLDGTTTFSHGALSGCVTGLSASGGTSDLAFNLIKAKVGLNAPATLDHNTIVDSSGTGVRVDFGSGTFTFTNNIVSNHPQYGVWFYWSGAPTRVFDHNDIWGNSTDLYHATGGAGALSSDPLYVSPGTDYSLQISSPCRNAASDGTDIGAFPFVPAGLDHVTLTPTTSSLAVDGTLQFTATAWDASNNPLPGTHFIWTAAPGAGTVTSSGLFTAGTVAGTFTRAVRATSGSFTASADLTVLPSAVSTVTITPGPTTVSAHGTMQFTAEAKDLYGNVVTGTTTWSVTPPTAGAISSGGLFTAGSVAGNFPGAVVATVNGVSGSADVEVTPGALAVLKVTPQSATVAAGESLQFTATGEDVDGNAVSIAPTWEALDGVGTIDATGALTATHTAGSYPESIRATADGIIGQASVSVIAGNLSRMTISPENSLVAVRGTILFSAHGFDAFDNEISGLTPTWAVVAGGGTISGQGEFTAGDVSGTFANTVQATLGGMSATTTVTVAADFDQDGLPDEWELANGLDPDDATDALMDPDADKLTNAAELATNTDPRDADSDDDGVLDGDELEPTVDTDGDGLPNALDPDSDGDLIFDGTELSVTSASPDTDLSRETFQADADPSTRTDPLNRNTDGDAHDDGFEDANHNGAIDPGETDPATPETFCSTDADCGSDNVCQASICAPKPVDRPEVTGCGCASGGTSDFDALALALLALGLAATISRRRRAAC